MKQVSILTSVTNMALFIQQSLLVKNRSPPHTPSLRCQGPCHPSFLGAPPPEPSRNPFLAGVGEVINPIQLWN